MALFPVEINAMPFLLLSINRFEFIIYTQFIKMDLIKNAIGYLFFISTLLLYACCQELQLKRTISSWHRKRQKSNQTFPGKCYSHTCFYKADSRNVFSEVISKSKSNTASTIKPHCLCGEQALLGHPQRERNTSTNRQQ